MSIRYCAVGCGILVALAFGGPLAAQEDPPSDRQIVVTADREPATQSQITEQARHISIIGSPLDNPLPRFEDRLCPGVLGLKGDAAAYIIQRLRYNAEQFGVPTHPDDGTCQPNLIVAFVEDAQNQLVELARNQGYMLAGLSIDERGELLDAPGAARVWVNTVTRTASGMPVPSQRDASSAPERVRMYDPESGLSASLDLPAVARGWETQSRIAFSTREDIVSVMVLFDNEQVRGKSLLQLADYATMRGLAFTRETRGELSAGTILSLFDGEGPKPARLTSFDLGYLGSLYDGIPNLPAASKLAGVSRHIDRQEEAAEAQE